MNWSRRTARGLITALLSAAMLLPVAGHALTQVSGPLQVGPSNADGNDQDHSAVLSTTLTNQGGLPDRLVNVACPGIGAAALVNGQMRQVGDVQRNGLDLPASLDGRATPVQAQFNLTNATQPMTRGSLIPCALYFQHAGQRIVVFSLGTHETATNEP